MSLLDQKLAALPIGSHVRFVHRSGQIIEGIVMENDGKDALSVQITSTATLRFCCHIIVFRHQRLQNKNQYLVLKTCRFHAIKKL